MAQGIDELGLAAIGVKDEAVAVAVGIDDGHPAAGRVEDLRRADSRWRSGCRWSCPPRQRSVVVMLVLASWTRIGRFAASNVVVVRLSNGSTLATGRMQLVEHAWS